MKHHKIIKLYFALSLFLAFASCQSNNDLLEESSRTNESIEIVEIELGETRCFETFSEAERFEGKLLYV